jgi:NADH-ubiquinone oxidoreductase chain 6
MSNLFILNETFTNGLNYNLLNIITFSSIMCGIFVIISKNPVVSVLFLIGLFLNIAGYLMMLGINFIGLSYLLVYVGAVSILFLFILMLINVRISELVTDNNNSLPLAIMIGTIFNITLYKLLPSNFSSNEYSFAPHKLGSDKSLSEIQTLAGDNVTSDLYGAYNTHNDNLSFVSSQI